MIYHKLLNQRCIHYHPYCMKFEMVSKGDPSIFVIILMFIFCFTWIHFFIILPPDLLFIESQWRSRVLLIILWVHAGLSYRFQLTNYTCTAIYECLV